MVLDADESERLWRTLANLQGNVNAVDRKLDQKVESLENRIAELQFQIERSTRSLGRDSVMAAKRHARIPALVVSLAVNVAAILGSYFASRATHSPIVIPAEGNVHALAH